MITIVMGEGDGLAGGQKSTINAIMSLEEEGGAYGNTRQSRRHRRAGCVGLGARAG